METKQHRDAPRTGGHAQNEKARPPVEGTEHGTPGTGRGTRRAEYTASAGQKHSTSGLAAPLLARLDMVRPAGPGRYYARCPVHDDHSPSLTVREDGERVLFHCFGGCDPSDVLTAVGLQWGDLYPDRWECARKRPNEAAGRYARRSLADMDPMDLERLVLRVIAADLRAGKVPTAEDRARGELARERLAAASGVAA